MIRNDAARTVWLESKWTRVDGLLMHARVTGSPLPDDATPVVLVHGIGITSRYWIPTAIRLAAEFNVAAPDLPGFGKSDKPEPTLDVGELADWLARWIRVTRMAPAALIGNSFGCQIIAELAVRHPDVVERIVLQGPTTDPHGNSAWEQFRRWQRNNPNEPFTHKIVSVRDYADCGVRRIWETWMISLRDHIEEKLPRISVPALVVRGSRDPIVPQQWAEEAARLLPRGKLVVIPDGRHTINFSSPIEFTRVLRPFLHCPTQAR
jgi:pimeloyl-ACP methyl ester carboxylesterase